MSKKWILVTALALVILAFIGYAAFVQLNGQYKGLRSELLQLQMEVKNYTWQTERRISGLGGEISSLKPVIKSEVVGFNSQPDKLDVKFTAVLTTVPAGATVRLMLAGSDGKVQTFDMQKSGNRYTYLCYASLDIDTYSAELLVESATVCLRYPLSDVTASMDYMKRLRASFVYSAYGVSAQASGRDELPVVSDLHLGIQVTNAFEGKPQLELDTIWAQIYLDDVLIAAADELPVRSAAEYKRDDESNLEAAVLLSAQECALNDSDGKLTLRDGAKLRAVVRIKDRAGAVYSTEFNGGVKVENGENGLMIIPFVASEPRFKLEE